MLTALAATLFANWRLREQLRLYEAQDKVFHVELSVSADGQRVTRIIVYDRLEEDFDLILDEIRKHRDVELVIQTPRTLAKFVHRLKGLENVSALVLQYPWISGESSRYETESEREERAVRLRKALPNVVVTVLDPRY